MYYLNIIPQAAKTKNTWFLIKICDSISKQNCMLRLFINGNATTNNIFVVTWLFLLKSKLYFQKIITLNLKIIEIIFD